MAGKGRVSKRSRFGSVRKLPSRRYQASYWHFGERHVAPTTFRTSTEAEDWLSTEKVKVLNGSWINPSAGNMSLAELSARWLSANPGKRESTLSRDEIALRGHILPALAQRRISSITPVDVQSLVNRWSERQAPATVRRNYDVLRAVLNHAVRVDLLARTPCRGVNLPTVEPRYRRALTSDDVAKIAEAMPDDHALMVWLGAVMGFRWGEVAGLRMRSIDLHRLSISVTEQVTRGIGGRTIIGPPKSKAGVRTLALPPELAELVLQHISRRDLTSADGEAHLFVTEAGGPMGYSNFRRRIWEPATRVAGLSGVGFHDLRRAAATALVAEMVDIKTAQARLGHADPRLTLAIYAQATTDADQLAAAKLGARFLSSRS